MTDRESPELWTQAVDTSEVAINIKNSQSTSKITRMPGFRAAPLQSDSRREFTQGSQNQQLLNESVIMLQSKTQHATLFLFILPHVYLAIKQHFTFKFCYWSAAHTCQTMEGEGKPYSSGNKTVFHDTQKKKSLPRVWVEPTKWLIYIVGLLFYHSETE